MLFGKLIRTSVAALGALAVSSVTQANAADIYSGGGYKDVPVAPPCCSFAGFYVGGAMGMAWIDVDRPSGLFTDHSSWGYGWTNTGTFNDQKLKSVNGFGGGQLGYNYQSSCCWLFGIEVDLGALGVNNNFHRNLLMNDKLINSVSLDGNNNDDAFFAGDVTGRIGYTFGNSMVYAKGGFAFVDLNNNMKETIFWKPHYWGTPTGNAFDTFSGNNNDNWLTGWTVGAGWEWKPCCQSNWSIKVEYLHYDFGSNNNNNCCNDWFNQTYPSTINNRFRTGDVTADTVKVGFNYFWSPGYSAQPPLK